MAEWQPNGEDGECPETDESCLRVDAAVFVGDEAGYEAANRGGTVDRC
jgi:hypothetical protein